MMAPIKAFLDFAAFIWKTLVGLAMNVAMADPTGGTYAGLHRVAKTAYGTILDITIPLATIFFLVAIIKDATQRSGEAILQSMVASTIKFICILILMNNMITLLDTILQIGANIGQNIGNKSTNLTFDTDAIISALETDLVKPTFDIMDLKGFFNDLLNYIFSYLAMFIGTLVAVISVVASAISIVGAAFQRILKPLIIMPFSCVSASMSAAEGELGGAFNHFLKTFVSFALGGAFIILSVQLGTKICSTSIFTSVFADRPTGLTGTLLDLTQYMLGPMITAGLVKASDSVLSRLF